MTTATTTDLDALVGLALRALDDGRCVRGGPVPRGTPADVAAAVDVALGGAPLPEDGVGDTAALSALVTAIAAGAADPADPMCAAHLHCPPLPVAVAADLAASALNQSLDSWARRLPPTSWSSGSSRPWPSSRGCPAAQGF